MFQRMRRRRLRRRYSSGPALDLVATVTSFESSFMPDMVIFRGLQATDYAILDGCRSPVTLRTEDGAEYYALADDKLHRLRKGDRVAVTIQSVRLPSLAHDFFVVTHARAEPTHSP